MTDDREYDPDERRYLEEMQQGEHKFDPKEVIVFNKLKKVRMHVQLVDQENEEVPLTDILDELHKHVVKNMTLEADPDNHILNQVFPIMSGSSAYLFSVCMNSVIGQLAAMSDQARLQLVQGMCCAFMLLKVIQNKKLKIQTTEEPISDREIATAQRNSKRREIEYTATLLGVSVKELLVMLVQSGRLTKEELAELLQDDANETT
jgi:hypothetical protein